MNLLNPSYKIVAVVLLAYTLFYGLKTPLAPSVYKVQSSINADAVVLDIELYNLNAHNSTIDLYLEDDGDKWQAKSIAILDATHVQAVFEKQARTNRTQNLFLTYQSANLGGKNSFLNAIQVPMAYLQNENQIATAIEKSTEWHEGMQVFPFREQLYETIRNLFFHVPMWFVMLFLSAISLYYSISYLKNPSVRKDMIASQAIKVAVLFGALGLVTGSIWARFTWGSFWVSQDVKLNGAAISMLLYLAYLWLRSATKDDLSRAKLSAVYNIFAFTLMMVFMMILPRMLDSLHPGNGGNPAFSKYDLDSSLRTVFYPAVLSWILLAIWILEIRIRLCKIKPSAKSIYGK